MGKKLTVKTGKGQLILSKSKELVGLKSAKRDPISDANFVEQKYFTRLGGFEVVSLNEEGTDVDDQLDKVRSKSDVAVGTHVYYAEGSDRPLVPTGEVFIEFYDGVSYEEQMLCLDEYALELVERRDHNNIVAQVTSKSPNPIKVGNYLQKVMFVKSAEPDLDTYVDEYEFMAPADQLIEHQWHLKNDGYIDDANYAVKAGADAKILQAWERMGGFGSSNIKVAVIDNGFDTSHPDLKGKVVKPFDLWTQSSRLLEGDASYTHGTPCASIAVAAANGGGIVGSAPNARFMPISGTSFGVRSTEQMFDYCIKNGADVVSCSWGTTDANFALNDLKTAAIRKAATKGRNGKGCVILYAVGNDNLDYVNYYAKHPDVIAVGASTSKDKHAMYSNRGKEVWVVAPSNGDWPLIAARAWWDEGTDLRGPGHFKYWADGVNRGDQYKHFGGTSAATPLVAGICALMLSVNPDLTAKQVKNILRDTADKIGEPWEYVNGHSKKYGYGRVNADKAVAEAARLKRGGGSWTDNSNTGNNTNTGGNTNTNNDNEPNPNDEPPPKTKDTDTPGPGPGPIHHVINKSQGLFKFSVQPYPASGWSVQTAVFAKYGNVLIHAQKYESEFGVPVLVNINELKGQTVYKLSLGAFENKQAARGLLKRMKSNGISGFLRNLKDFA